ncbi:MAG: hypothetical protein ACHQU0_02290 [Candidatus Paceibacteria bacterium]
MKNVLEHIDHIKGKPHHIRKRVALGVAAGTSAFIGLLWFGVSFATGSFAIQGSDFSMASGQAATVTTVDASGNQQNLAGADAASILQPTADAPAHIEIVDTTPAAPAKSDPTILPF